MEELRFSEQIVTKAHGTLGKEIRISPKANMAFNEAGASRTWNVESVEVCLEIGDEHRGFLTMSAEAYRALLHCPLHITTNKQFREEALKKLNRKGVEL